MPKFSQKSIDQLKTCDTRLQMVMMEAIKYIDFSVVQGHRGKEEQNAAYAAGKSQKKWPDGNHNSLPSKAVDIQPYPYPEKKYETAMFSYMAGWVMGIAAKMGIELRWGGDWNMNGQVSDNTFNDLFHFEIVE